MLRVKTYYFYTSKALYGKNRLFLSHKLRIECLGGESMTEKKELVFLEPKDIPRLVRGRQGRDWFALFDQIPKGKLLAMETEVYGSAPNIRAQATNYNADKKAKVLKATQRTDKKTEKTIVYVQRVA